MHETFGLRAIRTANGDDLHVGLSFEILSKEAFRCLFFCKQSKNIFKHLLRRKNDGLHNSWLVDTTKLYIDIKNCHWDLLAWIIDFSFPIVRPFIAAKIIYR